MRYDWTSSVSGPNIWNIPYVAWASWNSVAGVTTLNPSDKNAHLILSGGNLTVGGDGALPGSAKMVRSTTSVARGKVYWEMTGNDGPTASGFGSYWGVQDASLSTADGNFVGGGGTGTGWGAAADFALLSASNFSGSVATVHGGGINTFGFAYDATAGKIWFRNASGWISGDPLLGTSPTATRAPTVGPAMFVACSMLNDFALSWTFNFGASNFVYPIPG